MPPYEGNRRRSGIVHARFMFNTRKQEPSESFDDFVSSLQKLSSKCHYDASPPFVQSLLRDRLIVGISNKEIQSKLIQQSDDLSLTSAIEIVRLSAKDCLEKSSIKQENYDEENTEPVNKVHGPIPQSQITDYPLIAYKSFLSDNS